MNLIKNKRDVENLLFFAKCFGVQFKSKKEYFEFWNTEFGQNELGKQLKASHYKIKDKNRVRLPK